MLCTEITTISMLSRKVIKKVNMHKFNFKFCELFLNDIPKVEANMPEQKDTNRKIIISCLPFVQYLGGLNNLEFVACSFLQSSESFFKCNNSQNHPEV